MSEQSFWDKAGDTLLTGLGKAIDRETRAEPTVVVNDPTPVRTTENTGGGDPQTYQAGSVREPVRIAGLPWHQALLYGSVALLGVAVVLKVVK